MTLSEATRAAACALARGGIETPELDARVLAAEAFGVGAADALVGAGRAPAAGLDALDGFVARRLAGEPVARILGRREFWGLDFALAPETLAPRPDTETVVETALSFVADRSSALRVLDLGTGTGCILLALLAELPRALGVGVDLAPGSAGTARRNAERLGLAGRASFLAGRWAEALNGRFDLVVSNPPYIESGAIAGLDREVRLHDPALALDGGADGLDAYRAILRDLPRLLAPEGSAVLEHGAGQGEAVAAIARGHGLDVAAASADLAGVRRALAVRSPADGGR